jgi:two-component system, NtrC family, sensor kinase
MLHDMEVVMLRWPIRVKLIVGLSMVVGMMLILMGASNFGLHSFHLSCLTLVDQLRELGASGDLMKSAARLHAPRVNSPEEIAELKSQVIVAQQALEIYVQRLKHNSFQGSRVDSGTEELGLAFLIDDDLANILSELDPASGPPRRLLPGTKYYLDEHPELLPPLLPPFKHVSSLAERIDRLNDAAVIQIPKRLYDDFWSVLKMSQLQYQTARVIVWTSSLMVLGLLYGLMMLFRRWVLAPLQLLKRGVRDVAMGSFDYKLALRSGDEMQDLAEAFNDMTAKISLTYADLERQVQERSRQLVRSERLAGVGFLAAGVAHEINNPLASIAFCAEALDGRLDGILKSSGDPERRLIAKYLKMIQEEAFRCKNITEKLLDFSRCTDIKRERIDLAGLIQGVVEMIRHIGKYTGKSIVFYPRDAVMAHVDSQEIKQVVLNLIVNALEAMETSGTLRIDVRYNRGMAEMVFADTGCGMSADVLENIFEPFFTRRRDGKGTGLGLSITHRIVNQHHGEIMAESGGDGKGSTFIVRLPIDPTEIADDGPGAIRSLGRHRAEPAASALSI